MLYIIGLLISLPVCADTIDSLQRMLRENLTDTQRVRITLQIVEKMQKNDPEKAKHIAIKSLSVCDSIGYEKGKGAIYDQLGILSLYSNEPEEAIQYHNKAIQIYTQINDIRGLASAYNNLGEVYKNRGEYESAMKNYIMSVNKYEEINDKDGEAAVNLNMGAIAYHQGKYEKALTYFEHSYEAGKRLGDSVRMANSVNNIGAVYNAMKDFKKAIGYYKESYRLKKVSGNKIGAAMSLNNIGAALKEIGDVERDKKYYKEALGYHLKSLAIREEVNNMAGIAMSQNNIGEVYMAEGKLTGNKAYFQKAEHHFLKSIKLSEKVSFRNLQKHTLNSLSVLYELIHDYRSAYQYHKKYVILKDSMLNEQTTKQLTEIETKYETEKKEKEIKLQQVQLEKNQAEIKKQATQRNALFAGLSLVLLLAGAVFRSYRIKKRANKLMEERKKVIEEKNENLKNANKEITLQKEIILEKNEDIISSIRYAQRIQQAILPPDQFVNQALSESFVLYLPKDIVSGDFYWVEEKDDQVFFSVVDCTGHGVPGAFVSIMGYNGLNQSVNEYDLKDPGKILDKLNDIVQESFHQREDSNNDTDVQDGMDLALCRWDRRSEELYYAGANNPLYIIREEELIEIKADKQPIGKYYKRSPYTTHKLKIKKGDLAVIFSDGYADQFGGPKGKKFKYSRFKELLKKHKNATPEDLHQTLLHHFETWKENEVQIDDVCIMGVKFS